MKLIIDPDVVEKYNLTMPEFLLLTLVMNKVNEEETQKSLIQKGLLISTLDFGEGETVTKTQYGIEVYNNVLMDSSPVPSITEERLTELAKQLKEIYPKGKKEDTWYWAEGVQLIARRLRIFFHKYDPMGSFTDEQIINATRRYVDEKQCKSDMRLLKYFIFKEGVGKGGDVEPSSDLLTYIENEGQVNELPETQFLTLF